MSHLVTYLLIASVLSTVLLACIDTNMDQTLSWFDDGEEACASRCGMANVTLVEIRSNISSSSSPVCNCTFAGRHPNTLKRIQKTFDILTMVMPLFSSFLLAMLHKFDPKLKWLSLKFAAAQVEAEIYKYRLRVGHYENVKIESKWWRMARSGQLKSAALQAGLTKLHEAHKGEARTKFGEQLKMIDKDLMNGAIQSSALKAPKSGFFHGKAKPPETRGLKLAYKGKDPNKAPNPDYADVEEEENKTALAAERDAAVKEATRAAAAAVSTTTAKKVMSSLQPSILMSKPPPPQRKTFTAGRAVTQDDGISLLDVSVYVQRRLQSKLGSLREDLPKKERKYKLWQVFAYIFTIAGSFLASYNNAQWVPAVAAIAAAIKAVNEYQSLEQSIPITNNAIQQLEAMDTWWRSLSMVEKQTPAYKNIVVEVTEDAICNAVGSWVAMMKTNHKMEGSAKKPNDNGEDDPSTTN